MLHLGQAATELNIPQHQHTLKYRLKPRGEQGQYRASNENQTEICQRFHCCLGPVQAIHKVLFQGLWQYT